MVVNSSSRPSAGSPNRRSNIAALAALWTAFASLLVPAGAQQGDVALKIDVVAWGDEIGGLSFKAGEKAGEIKALSFRYSEPVSYTGPALMEIFKNGGGTVKPVVQASKEDLEHESKPLVVEEPKNADGGAAPKSGLALELEKRRTKTPNLVSLAQLPSGCRRATLLMAPLADGTYLSYVINDDPTKLPLGQIRIHNLCPFPIAMRCNGAQPKELQTREILTVPCADGALTYEIAFKEGDEWKFQEHNIIPVRPDEQTQMIVLRSNNAFFKSADGSTGGFLQAVTLRRGKPD